jgi:CDP-6-deoxy-D-xylo-4-hexulose-3-dehydrase
MENKKLKNLRLEIANLVKKYSEEKYKPTTFIGGKTLIPPSGKLLGEAELQNMVSASLDGWLTTGRFNTEFESKLADFLGVKYCLSVNSGSSANLVAFSTLTSQKLGDRAIQKGDEVIGVAAGFPTTVNPIIQYGAIPVFVDVDIKTHNINVDLIEAAITPKTKAIMLAHALGNPFNVGRVKEICDKYNLWLIEDTCDALGAEFNGQKCGTFGDIGTLSFYPAHHMTMGEGGAVFMNNLELKVIAESFRDWGRDCYCAPGCDNTCGCRFEQKHGNLPYGYDHKYVYSHSGYNLKITDMQAACGLAQLGKLDFFIKKRRSNYTYLRNKLESLSDFIDLPTPTPNSNPSWFGFPITLKDNCDISRVDVTKFLDSHKIGSRLLFAGNLLKQPYFKDVEYKVVGDLTHTEKTMNDTFWIGVQPALNEEHFDFVAEKFEELFGLNF